ncbi:MAG: hypothetical protein M9938_02460 [Solirubrobacterales bacterium]|nr:hypothetical protein [Solirubrobacterales bacterium]
MSFRRFGTALLVLITALGLSAAASSAASAQGKKCGKLPLSVKLSTHNPTDLLEAGYAWVYVAPRAKVFSVQVKVRRGKRVFAKGRISGRPAGGRTSVVRLHLRHRLGAGRYRVETTARKAGCSKRRSKSRIWGFRAPSLPIKAAPFSTRVKDNTGVVRFALRPIRRTSIGRIRATLVNADGATVAEQVIADLGRRQMIAELPIRGTLRAGRYRIRLNGRDLSSGRWQQSAQTFRFVAGGGGAKPVKTTGMMVQKVAVDWSRGEWNGRQVGGFIAPGIGYGEIVCSPEQQWIRFYPSNGGREAAMMTWTYKDWGTWREKSLREAKYADGTGPDFREGFNKFGPTEKWSTGSFQGIISDRGPILGPGGVSLAQPTTYDLDWEWDFSKPKRARCNVKATFRTGTDLEQKPLARAVQIVWRGEANATTPEKTESSYDFPGLGRVTAICRPGPTGTRRLIVDSPVGGRVTTREGSEDTSVTQTEGPLIMRLPNNGMLFVQLNSGERILVSSRWKTNDPTASRNWCVVSAQIYSV